jgi:hypothetical protein
MVQREVVFIDRYRLWRLNELAAIASIIDARARYLGDLLGPRSQPFDEFFIHRSSRELIGIDFLVESQTCVLVPEGAVYQITDLEDFIQRSRSIATRSA